MDELLLISASLLVLLFLVLGIIAYFRNWSGKWIYFSLSALILTGTILMLIFSKIDFLNFGQNQTNGTPNTENVNNNQNKETEKEPSGGKNKDPGTPTVEEPPTEPVTPIPNPAQQPSEEPIKPVTPTQPMGPEPTVIVVPENGTVQYTVVKGDTLWSISRRSGVSIQKIKQWNSLTTDVIHVGQILTLYGKNIEPNPPKTEIPPTTATSVLISHGSIQKRQIALTFDAGSDAVGIRILDVLNQHHVKATFFLTGKWVEKFPAYAQRIVNDGHAIGNHTYSHPDPVKISSSAFLQDIINGEQAIKAVTGKSPRPYLRFPYGSYNASALKTVGAAGYPLSIQWSLDTIDWQQPTTEVIVSRIEAGASNGDIILMHIGGINTPQAVDTVIPKLKAQGYQLVTLDELLQ